MNAVKPFQRVLWVFISHTIVIIIQLSLYKKEKKISIRYYYSSGLFFGWTIGMDDRGRFPQSSKRSK
jgi:hypothetical protein